MRTGLKEPHISVVERRRLDTNCCGGRGGIAAGSQQDRRDQGKPTLLHHVVLLNQADNTAAAGLPRSSTQLRAIPNAIGGGVGGAITGADAPSTTGAG
jgi:hypothetical protein